jgi:predicted Fe-Mo cluster-binding NifX family protein
MIVCVACSDPGGLDAAIDAPFKLTAILDYYDFHADGYIGHLAHMRNCGDGGCIDPVEAMKRRGVEKVIATGLSPGNLLWFRNHDIRVLRTENPSVRLSLDALVKGELKEIAIDQFSMVSEQKT